MPTEIFFDLRDVHWAALNYRTHHIVRSPQPDWKNSSLIWWRSDYNRHTNDDGSPY